VVGAGLPVYADDPEGSDGAVGDCAEDGVPDVENEHEGFDEEDEG